MNADDFGLSESVNTGVQLAHRLGILTSATLLANSPGFEQAVRIAGENPGLGVGAHLNLVRGVPVSPPAAIPLLADGAGNFRPFRIRRMTRDFLSQAEREYRAQLEKILGAGILPTHVDFEKHHAWQRPLYSLAGRLAEEYGVRGIRNLAEPVWFSLRKTGWPGLAGAGMAAALRAGFTLGGGRATTGLARPDWFFGQTHIGGMTEAVWLRLLAALPPGVSEVMVHPGCANADAVGGMGTSWIEAKRAAELEALISPAVRSTAAAQGISLINYRRKF